MKKKNNSKNQKTLKLEKTSIMKLNPKQMNHVIGGVVIKDTQQTVGNTVRTSTANDCGTITVTNN